MSQPINGISIGNKSYDVFYATVFQKYKKDAILKIFDFCPSSTQEVSLSRFKLLTRTRTTEEFIYLKLISTRLKKKNKNYKFDYFFYKNVYSGEYIVYTVIKKT